MCACVDMSSNMITPANRHTHARKSLWSDVHKHVKFVNVLPYISIHMHHIDHTRIRQFTMYVRAYACMYSLPLSRSLYIYI